MGDPGIPREIMGSRAPVPAELAADWGARIPSMAPFPYLSGSLEYCLAIPYPRKEAGVAPVPGRMPTKKPRKALSKVKPKCFLVALRPP